MVRKAPRSQAGADQRVRLPDGPVRRVRGLRLRLDSPMHQGSRPWRGLRSEGETMTTAIRPMQPGDRPFVVSGWSRSLKFSRDVPLVPMSMWASTMHPVIERLLDRPAARTLVAHGEVLQGFVCAEPDYVFYLYV